MRAWMTLTAFVRLKYSGHLAMTLTALPFLVIEAATLYAPSVPSIPAHLLGFHQTRFALFPRRMWAELGRIKCAKRLCSSPTDRTAGQTSPSFLLLKLLASWNGGYLGWNSGGAQWTANHCQRFETVTPWISCWDSSSPFHQRLKTLSGRLKKPWRTLDPRSLLYY